METVAKNKKTLETICAHADHSEKDPYGAHALPVYQTSTFRFDDSESGRRFFAHEVGGASHSYSRIGNPTVQKAEQVIAEMEGIDLEEKTEGMLFGSGMAAITTGLLALGKNKRIVAQNTLYGCTSQFLHESAPNFNISVTHIDPNDIESIERIFSRYDDIGLVYLESIANPTMRVCDIELIVNIAHGAGAFVMVDNTFATPYHIRPLNWGADLVAHSTTKYLNGHGTVVGGALVAKEGFFGSTDMHTYRKNFGGISGPFDAWLTVMGLKTFPLRMKQHSYNGKRVAEYLNEHPKVINIRYTGLAEHPDSEIIQKLMMNGHGGMIAFELTGGYYAAVDLMDKVKLATLAVSLGTVDTLIQHPASMTHAVVSSEVKKNTGITDGLVRISVGTEYADDIIHDLEQSLL